MASFTERMIGAAKLDVHTYEEVEADLTATPQAMGVVVLSSIAAGVGSFGPGASGMISGVLGNLIGWFIGALLIFIVGTKLLPEARTRSDLGELLRTIGFASSPGMLYVLGILLLGPLVVFIVAIWMLVAFVVAVRQALDFSSTGRAVIVCLIGWVVYVAFRIVLGMILGGGAALT